MSSLAAHSVTRHLSGVTFVYSALISAYLFLHDAPLASSILALIVSAVLLINILSLSRSHGPLLEALALVVLAIAFTFAHEDIPDPSLIVGSWIFIVCFSQSWKRAVLLAAPALVGLPIFIVGQPSVTTYAVLLASGVFGAYLRWLIMYQDLEIQTQSQIDNPSGCRNIDALHDDAEQYFRLQERYGIPCSLLVIDARYSATSVQAQRALLAAAIGVWVSRIRKTDLLYRVNDHRFVCLVTATVHEQAKQLLEDLSKATEAYDLPGDAPIEVKIRAFDSANMKSCKSWLAPVYD